MSTTLMIPMNTPRAMHIAGLRTATLAQPTDITACEHRASTLNGSCSRVRVAAGNLSESKIGRGEPDLPDS